jgi:hypothetical protein
MNAYKFHAVQHEHDGSCSVTVEQNGKRIERYWFDTPEWALFFKRTCEALDNTRYQKFLSTRFVSNLGDGICCSSSVYTKEEVDALIQRITSLEHWLEPLRTEARRLWDALMWGERGRA